VVKAVCHRRKNVWKVSVAAAKYNVNSLKRFSVLKN